jgi:hypothetical protein
VGARLPDGPGRRRLTRSWADTNLGPVISAGTEPGRIGVGQVCQVTSCAVTVAVRSWVWAQTWWYSQTRARLVSSC